MLPSFAKPPGFVKTVLVAVALIALGFAMAKATQQPPTPIVAHTADAAAGSEYAIINTTATDAATTSSSPRTVVDTAQNTAAQPDSAYFVATTAGRDLGGAEVLTIVFGIVALGALGIVAVRRRQQVTTANTLNYEAIDDPDSFRAWAEDLATAPNEPQMRFMPAPAGTTAPS